MFDVCVVGSSNLDLVVTTPRLPTGGETIIGSAYGEYPGGKGLNQAVAAARCGARVAFSSALGDDAAGEGLLGLLVREGVDPGAVQIVEDFPSGRALIMVDAAAENMIVVVPGANAAMASAMPPASRVVLGQLEVPQHVVADAFAHAHAAGAVTVLNPAPASPIEDDLLANCTVVIPNEHEREALGGTARLFALGVEMIVTTLGARGVEVATPADRYSVPAFPVSPIDTTGAGDAFCGAFAAAIADGRESAEAIRFASAAGALATTTVGAVPSLPRRAAIEAFLRRT